MSIDVSGGAGGVSAVLADLDDAAFRLARAGVLTEEMSRSCLRIGVDPVLVAAVAAVAGDHPAAALAAARLAGEAEAAALASAARLAFEAVEVGALGAAVLAAVAAYRAAEAAEVAAVARVQDAVMAEVGVAAPLVLLGLAAAAALEASGVDVAGAADHAAYDHPWLVDLAGGGVDGLLRGLATRPECALVLGVAAARAGVRWPPTTPEQATAVLQQVGAIARALDEDGHFGSVVVGEGVPVAVDGPRGVADLAAGEVDLGSGGVGRVRVVQVPQPDGSSAWVVELPGTQVWDPRPGSNPFDLSSDVEAMSGEATLAAAGAAAALDAAQVRAGRDGSGDPVMLVGHSQGGILAASMAGDAGFRATHRVTALLTMGAPVAHFPIPPSVSVLSLEHVQDPVPRLDGSANPDRPSWTTVRRDLSAEGPGARSAGPGGSAAASHAATRYAETGKAVDDAIAADASVSLSAWRVAAAPFLRAEPGAPATVTDFQLRRIPVPP